MITGWPPGLMQDDCKKLSQWLSTRVDALHVHRINMEKQVMPSLEATRLNNCWIVRPVGQLGTCGWIKGKPWMAAYSNAKAAERAIQLCAHKVFK